MESISQLLDRKGREVYSVNSQTQVIEAIRLMADKGIGALLVIDDGQMAGIVSERDYARKVILKGKSSSSTPVADIMTKDVVSIDPHRAVDDCLSIMTQNRIRHLPVLEGDEVVGVLSIGDLVASIIEDQQHQISSLEQYISS